ncbi:MULTISPECIES: hypothetical protein [unclassified Burkholderia]|uniref:hypothetical protein n=1 Tax=unclassified Burkholderia TaxID=2613784 RepID=UPI00141EA99C|nr:MULTISPECIES: hypothetical protein [unclassified Burkholderia]NIE85931.1 hypothetical protein [Burkholderia sp. Tr-860]NIF66816.1 hypothetical protein [Burkholderia sp. Cy-647]
MNQAGMMPEKHDWVATRCMPDESTMPGARRRPARINNKPSSAKVKAADSANAARIRRESFQRYRARQASCL